MMNIIKTFNKYKRNYANYLSVMYNVKTNKPIFKVKLRNGQKHNWNIWAMRLFAACNSDDHTNSAVDTNSIEAPSDRSLKFIYKEKILYFEFDEWTDIVEVFGEEGYRFLDVENENVIDIGANIGDSTIYFAVSNARKVIGLEPYPHSYHLALKNLERNNIGKERVTLLNAGYGEDGIIHVSSDVKNTHGTNLKSSHEGQEIRTISLKTLLMEYNFEEPVLKMDCEGCEYNILNEDNDVLRKFKRIQIEYHYGYEKLKLKLENCGFTVSFTQPKQAYNPDATNPNMIMGQIYAKLSTQQA